MSPSPPGSGAGSGYTPGSGSGSRPGPGSANTPWQATGGGSAQAGFISRYQILDKIGEGGMGALFLARDPAIDRLLAIKLLRRGFDTDDLRQRFAREAKAAGRLRHPNIVTVFDVGEHEGDPFIAMEFLAGETVDQLIRHGARLSLARRLKLLEELCDGLSYAHRAGIVHRDVKPANLIVDSEGILKILDFGIVRLAEGGSTDAGMLVGTVNYMSPEQVAGEAVDHRSDIFAVGLVAYELLTSRQAFPGSLKDGLLNRILTGQREPLASVLPQLDPEVIRIVEQSLQRNPADRYQDLARMRNDLQRARQRIEAMEERAVEDMTRGGAETAVVPFPRVPTPAAGTPRSSPSLQAAERALENGDYRVALTLAGRSAASDPRDAHASGILARAEAALLERGRSLEQSAASAVPSRAGASGAVFPSGVAAPSGASAPSGHVPTSGMYGPQAAHPLLWAVLGAVVILVAIVAGVLVPKLLTQDGDRSAQNSAAPQEPQVSSPPASRPQEPPPPAAQPQGSSPSPAQPPGSSPTAAQPQTPVPAPPATADRSSGAARGRVQADREPPRRPQQRAEPDTRTPVSTTPPPSPSTLPPPPGSAGAAPAPPAIARAGRDVAIPRRIRYVEPQYPAAAVETRAQGTVRVEITIARDGSVADARVVESVRGLDDAAVAAVRRWEFAPTYVGGAAVPVLHVVDVDFMSPPRPAANPPATQPSAPAPPAGETRDPGTTATRKPGADASATPPRAETPTKPDPAAEATAVREALRRYEAAWDARDAAAVARVQQLSAEELARVRATIAGASDYALDLDIREINVAADGRHATAVAVVKRRFRARVGGKLYEPTDTHTFTLERRGDGWTITAIR